MYSLIVAIDRCFGIGKNQNLLCHLPKDMAYFKEKTLGNIIISGRKNYFTIPKKFRPLSHRTNIVLSRTTTINEPGVLTFDSIERCHEHLCLTKAHMAKEIFVIGGGDIYKQYLEKEYISKMYVTHIDHRFEADTFFPEIDFSNWKLLSAHTQEVSDENAYPLKFSVYTKSK